MNHTITHAEPTLKTVPRMNTRIFEIAARTDRAGVVAGNPDLPAIQNAAKRTATPRL